MVRRMPEFPDVSLYLTRMAERIQGQRLEQMRFFNPFILRSVDPPPQLFVGKKVLGLQRLGKRLVIEFEDDLFIVIHLMIAGRLIWSSEQGLLPFKGGKTLLAAWQWESGRLTLTEASTKKRAAIYLERGVDGLAKHRRSGADIFNVSAADFSILIKRENRTLKRNLTDPSAIDGIGNAYSDEILFEARLSPVRTTGSLSIEEVERLLRAAQTILRSWTERLESMYPDFPKPSQITAFRREFSVHGRFGQPCPVCGAPIQRIVYAENETNYCALCQNEGRLLADRSLSRLLKDDWPKTLEALLEGDR
jgi:formamidopyrimidine-DNA glycosylase